MDESRFSRTEILIGKESVEKLRNSRVAVFGVGGVGGYTVEALARSGVGAIDLIDNDTVNESNLNRQIIALRNTIGRDKVDVARERILQINEDCKVTVHKTFYLPETAGEFDFHDYDYVVDAIDTVTGKINLIMQARECKTPVISAMGAGNKLDPTLFEVADISKTSVCPLAKVMRRELKKRGVDHLKVVYSREQPLPGMVLDGEATDEAAGVEPGSKRRSTPGSIAFVPSVVGLIIAGEVVRDLVGITR